MRGLPLVGCAVLSRLEIGAPAAKSFDLRTLSFSKSEIENPKCCEPVWFPRRPRLGEVSELVDRRRDRDLAERGEERIGAFTGLYYLSSSAAAIAGPIIAGGLIDLTGKNYTTLWLFSAVFMAVAIFMMTQVQARRSLTKAYAAAEAEVED